MYAFLQKYLNKHASIALTVCWYLLLILLILYLAFSPEGELRYLEF